MRISRRALLLGATGAVVAGAGLVSLPGGGPQTFFGGAAAAYQLPPNDKRFQPEELRAELDWLVATMEAVGVKPYAYTSEAAFKASYARVSREIVKPMTVVEFYRQAGPLFATLNDGHASIGIAAHFEQYRHAGGTWFPLALNLYPDAVLVWPYPGSPLPGRTRLLEIDGQPAARVASDIVRFVGAQRPALRYAFAGGWTTTVLWTLWGPRAFYDVVAQLPGGATRQVRLEALSRKHLPKHAAAAASADSPYTFARIAGGRIGYLDYHECRDYDRFKTFLYDTFASVKRDPIDGLIIDIRQNGGGRSSLNELLWDYVTDKPYTQGGDMIVKVSDRLKREYGFFRYNDLYPPPAWISRDGSTIRFPSGLMQHRPSKNELRYTGPVYLLIGTQTFSSALMCAVAARDYGLATIVGQETGEPVNSTGEVYSGYSPRLGIQFGFTTKFFYGGKPRPDGQGVLPDVTVVPTIDDILAGRDPVRDRAVEMILKSV